MKYKQCSDLTMQSVEDEILILDVKNDHIHQLNPTACFIWLNCNGSNTEENLAQLLLDKYDIDQSTAEIDVANILKELQKLELIESV